MDDGYEGVGDDGYGAQEVEADPLEARHRPDISRWPCQELDPELLAEEQRLLAEQIKLLEAEP